MGNKSSRYSDYDPYGRRDVYRDPQMADPYRRPPPDMYGRDEPHAPVYSTSLPRDVREEARNGYSNGGYPPPPRDNGYAQRDNYGGPDRRPRGKEEDIRGPPQDPDEQAMYELDHLATFTVGQGVISPEDGIRKLRQMEASTGIWTMRAQLLVTPNEIIIFDKQTMEEIERFPMRLVARPMAVTNQIRRDIYNNIVLFTVMEDPRRDSPAEMHIFQCTARPAQDVVDDIIDAKEGRGKFSARQAPHAPAPQRENYRERDMAAERAAAAAAAYQPGPKPSRELQKSIRRRDTETESVLSEKTDKEVQLLNHCFDDIERFVGRLQQAAEAYKELDRRKRNKNKHDGMLSVRARPPPAQDFIDVFQKFKLSFNLLARLKPHIHDPNAPELVHFLFTPLSLVVEASKDPRNSAPDLPSRVISPLLTADARDLLRNCLNSKEMDLWFSLGDAWTLPKEQWRDHVPPYYPRFTDGWQPAPGVIEALNPDARSRDRDRYQPETRSSYDDYRYAPREDPRDRRYDEDDDPYRGRPPPSREPPREQPRDRHDYYTNDRPNQNALYNSPGHSPRSQSPAFQPPAFQPPVYQPRPQPPPPPPPPPPPAPPMIYDQAEREYEQQNDNFINDNFIMKRPGPGPSQPRDDFYSRDRNIDRDRDRERDREPPRDVRPSSPRTNAAPSYKSWDEEQAAYKDKLLRIGAKVFEVTTDRNGKNNKELTVKKGEILECLDDSRNWYKLRNYKGEVGHAPYTIIQAVRK